jgi:hypothetical protein
MTTPIKYSTIFFKMRTSVTSVTGNILETRFRSRINLLLQSILKIPDQFFHNLVNKLTTISGSAGNFVLSSTL